MRKVSFFLAVLLVVGLTLAPLQVLFETYFDRNSGAASNRLHSITSNTVRVFGNTPAQVSANLSQMRYPSGGPRPDLVVILKTDKWQDSLPASALCGVDGLEVALVFSSTAVNDAELVERLDPQGVERLNGLQVLLVGHFVTEYINLIENFGYQTALVEAADTAQLTTLIDEWYYRLSGERSRYLLVLPADKPEHAVAAGGLASGMGAVILYAREGKLDQQVWEVIRGRKDRPTTYIVGLKTLSKQETAVLRDLSFVRHIGHQDPVINSIVLARYYDPYPHFGFDYTDSSTHYHKLLAVVPLEQHLYAVAAAQLGVPLLLLHRDEIPHRLLNHLWEISPDFWVTPFEGPYVDAVLIGGTEFLSYGVQSRLDFLLETQPYETKGPEGISGLDALSLGWLVANWCASLWLFCHSYVRGKQISLLMKLAWVLLGLLLGPFAVYLYLTAYAGYGHQVAQGQFPRPLAVQAKVATVSTLGFGAPVMVLISYLSFYRGAPLIMAEGPFFFLGNPLLVSMAIGYAAALLVNGFVFAPTLIHSSKHMTYWQAIKQALPGVFAGMTAAFAGMLLVMWWLHMAYLPDMPEESRLLWWGTAYFSTLAAFITALPVNKLLVKLGLKEGSM